MQSKQTSGPVRAWRFSRLFWHLCWGLFLSSFWLPRLQGERRKNLVRRWSAAILTILNVRLQVSGFVPNAVTPQGMYVSNHISWLDIWIINSLLSPRFVAKSEVRSWPFIGWLAEKGGVIFIERARKQDTLRVSGAAAETLAQGESLCVFPEGTTTDGSFMVPFRSSLLQAAVDTGVLMRPMALRYRAADNSANTAIAYAGETTLLESMLAIVSQQEICAELEFLTPLPALEQDRRILAQQAESAIAVALNLPVRTAPEIIGGQLSAGP